MIDSRLKASFFTSCLLVVLIFFSCNNNPEYSKSFLGNETSVEKAERMYEAIGGMEAWCNLRSLYIKAEHHEPQMDIPYTSQIWRDVDIFDLEIEQENDSFHVKAIMNEHEGIITYLDDRDTSRILSNDQLAEWQFDHFHNVYVLLHKMGCNPEDYSVKIGENERLNFYKADEFVTAFELDDQSRPYIFYAPNSEGEINGSTFTQWGIDDGLVHSAGGHPLDSSFIYTTQIWIPSTLPMKEAMEQSAFY